MFMGTDANLKVRSTVFSLPFLSLQKFELRYVWVRANGWPCNYMARGVILIMLRATSTVRLG
jgi:hypothetical protein